MPPAACSLTAGNYPVAWVLHLSRGPTVCPTMPSGTSEVMTREQPEINPNALAVDSLPDDLRVGVDTQDETSTAQLTTGDIALTGGESAAGDTADGLTMSAEEALRLRGDTTGTARHADEVMDPPGPPSAS